MSLNLPLHLTSLLPPLSPLQISFPKFPARGTARPLPLQHRGDPSGVMPWELGAMPAPSTSGQSALILPGLLPRHGMRNEPSQWQEATTDVSPKSSPQKSMLVGDGRVGIAWDCPGDVSSAEMEHSAPRSLHLAGRGFPGANPALGGFVACRFKEPCGALSRATASLEGSGQYKVLAHGVPSWITIPRP